MEESNKKERKSGGRHPKKDPAVFRYSISLSAEENARFLSLFEASGMSVKAHFITACIFGKTIKTVKIDKAALDYFPVSCPLRNNNTRHRSRRLSVSVSDQKVQLA